MSNIVIHADDLRKQFQGLKDSGFLPAAIKTEAHFMAIVMKGSEVGMQPMQSIAQINVIQGKPCISAEGMLSLVFKNVPSASIVYKELSNSVCIIHAKRDKESDYSIFSFSIKDAELAQLTGKDTWKKYPRAMIKARCISEMCRSLFPDAIAGISYTPEELDQDIQIRTVEEAEKTKELLNRMNTQVVDEKEVDEVLAQVEIKSKKLPNKADQIKYKDMIVRFGKDYAGKKFSEVPPQTLDEMYAYAKKYPSKAMATTFMKDYETYFGVSQ